MGIAASWIAIRGLDRGEVAARLDCVETEVAADHRTELALGRTASGWLVVRCRRFDYPTPSRLSALSRQAELVACQAEEHVMASAAFAFRDGAQVWSIAHDPEKGLHNLSVEGAPPPDLDAIRTRLATEQDADGGEDAEVDFLFDAPAELVAVLTGFRQDEDDAISFTQLSPNRRGLLQSLFGRR